MIKIQIENNGQKLQNCQNLLQKAIKAEAKANLMPFLMVQKIDQCVTCGKLFMENNKANI